MTGSWVSVLVLPFVGYVCCIVCERIFNPSKRPTPNLTVEKLKMVADFCTQFIHWLHLQEEALGGWKQERNNQFRVDDVQSI